MLTSTGRVAVVTGANKGIGFFIALHLGQSNLFCHILLACRDNTRSVDAVNSLRKMLPESVTVSSEQLTLGDIESHKRFVKTMEDAFGRCDVLVNNAGMAFKGSDPTPFEQQCKPTLDVNFRGTVDFTERMIPLLKKGSDPRIVDVASMSGRLSQLSPELQKKVSSDTLTMDELQDFVNEYEISVMIGTHREKGFGNSNYGFSKLALIAATKVWAREHPDISINCCCPGYCKTDMSSQKGGRDPSDGAKNAVIPATMENPPTGEFFEDYKVSKW
jgi:carbonyl reductase 1